ncbi:putative protein EIN4-like [Capsicum annuum]|nr:putative protein EIN4-like [Capsicum annuum]KAF3666493.1 putative protein EIN4-like [Capsicum annuum]
MFTDFRDDGERNEVAVDGLSYAVDTRKRPSAEELVKNFSIDRYPVRMQCDGATNLMGDFVVKSAMGKSFDAFKKILREQKLNSYFSESCFGQYLDLLEDNNARFQMKMKMTSKRDVIPSKRTSYPYTLLEIKLAKRRKKDISKASLSIEKSKIATPLSLSCIAVQCTRAIGEQHELKKVDVTVEVTTEEHNITADNLSTASKEEEKVEPVSLGERKNYPSEGFNISDEAPKKLTNIPSGLPWHLVDEIYIPINCGDEFHWVLVVVILKERRIRVYDLMSRRRCFGPSSEIQKLAKILPTYLDMSDFLDQKVRTDLSTIEAYRDKMDNPFDVEYVEGISQQIIGSLNCGPFVVAYAEYLSNRLQVPNDGLDIELLCKRYAALLGKYGEGKA